MRRISVVGTSGSGKTTLARQIASALDIRCIELDALYWGPGWTPVATDEFRARVRASTDPDGWVADGNYRSVLGDLVWERADTVVWVDPPRRTVMRRVITRTLRRSLRREELWSGNRERISGLFFWRSPEESIVRWSWSTYRRRRKQVEDAMRDPAYAHLTFHRLRSRRDVDRFLGGLLRAGQSAPSR